MSAEPTRVSWRSLALNVECVLSLRARAALCALCEEMGGRDCYMSVPTLAARMGALTVGRGQDDGVDVGPLIEEKAVESVDQLVTDAVHDGARVLVGGTVPDGPGFFYPPTVLVDDPADSAINA